jgi:hypothetical protein
MASFIFDVLKSQPLGTLSMLSVILLPIISFNVGKGDYVAEGILAFIAATSMFNILARRRFEEMYKQLTGLKPDEVAMTALNNAGDRLGGNNEE